jgi:two-component system NtrC family sensor kinase
MRAVQVKQRRSDKLRDELHLKAQLLDVAHRMQAEELATTLIHSSQIGVYVAQDGKFQIINPQIMKVLGFSQDELLGENSLNLVHPEDRAMVRENAIKMLKGKRLKPYEFRVCDKDGNARLVMEVVAPITYKGKRAVLGNFMDVTEHKRAEEALRESEEKYKTLTEDAPIGIYFNDFRGTFLYGNKKAEEIIGYKREELQGKNFLKLKLIGPGEIRKAMKLLALNKLGKATGPDRFVLNKKDGTKSIVEIRTRIATVGGKKVILGMVEDITERMQAEEQLEKSQKFSTSLLESAPNPITVVNLDTSIRYVNPAFEKLTGFTLAEVADRKAPYPWWPEEQGKEMAAGLKKTMARGGKRSERMFQKKSGKRFWVEMSSAPVMQNGKPTYLIISWLDVTERKQAEEALRESEEKYRMLVEDAPVGIFNTDLKGKVTYVNKKVIEASGYSWEELVGKNGFRLGLFPNGMLTLLAKRMKDRLLGKPNRTLEMQLKCKDEHWIWVSMESRLLQEQGKPMGLQVIIRDITERKQAEEALQAEKNKLQSVINAMEDGLTIQDKDYNIIYQNEPLRILFGDTVGGKCYRVYEGSEKLCDGCPVEKAFKDGKSHLAERRVVLPSGEVTFWENRANPIRDAGGKITSCLEIARNITERKQAEEALAGEATRRRILVEQSRDGIVVLDEKGKVYEANQRFAEMLGYTPKEVRELNVWDWEAEFPRERVAEMIESVGPEGDYFETRHRRKDGTLYDVEISTNGAVIAGQKLIFCVCRDITKRKQAKEALRESQEKLRKMFESVTDGILVIDLDGIIIEANQRMVEIHGLGSKDELLGRNASEFVAPSDHERIANNMRQALKQGRVSGVEYTLLRADGTEFPAELSTSVLKSAAGNWAGHITIVRDVTERKAMEEQLMLTDRLASIGELASGIAHELNNPLTSIIGFSQLLMEGNIADNAREDLKLVHSEAKRAADIVKNLLTFARKHAPVKQLAQINNIIKDVLSLRAYEQKVSNIKVIKHFAPDLPEIMVDPFLMQQVFLNLIINAEYFMAEARSGGTLTITTKSSNDIVRVSFADDGPGIPRENLSRIFSPFFTTKEVGKGTGLGLSICHGIVAEHGGSIYARSQLGKGATFIIELPISSP